MENQNLKFDFVFLGQSVLKYQVPLDIFHSINQIYESNYNNLAILHIIVNKCVVDNKLFLELPKEIIIKNN